MENSTKEQFEKTALQNWATKFGLTVRKYYENDHRKKKNMWFLTKGSISVSPVLDYEGLNNFMNGWTNCLKQAE